MVLLLFDFRKKLLILAMLLPMLAFSQSKQKATGNFLKELNNIIQHSDDNGHWNIQGTMSVDTPFAINNKGILSVTVRFVNEEGETRRARMEAPVNKITRIAYDLFLILEYRTDEVTKYESEVNSSQLLEKYKLNYFHIGAPVPDGYKPQKKLQRLLDKMQKHYATEN